MITMPDKRLRAVIYARYSSDQQRAASIDDQLRVCRSLAECRGWQVVAEYTDAAMSGATAHRPDYRRMTADAERGAFDVVVAEALDRLSRDQADTAILYRDLDYRGIRIETHAEGLISEIHVGITGYMNATYRKELAAKTHRGLEGRVLKGRSAGGRCFGYQVVRQRKPDGEPETGLREVDSDEAAVVVRIFRAYAAGRSPRAIATELNAAGVPGPDGRRWSDTTIRGHGARGTGILRNELYAGVLVWNRQHYLKDPRTGRRVSRPNPPEKWIREDVPHLRIVDDALWSTVQAKLAAVATSAPVEKARATEFWKHRRVRHLLTDLAYCGACGGPLSSVGGQSLGCSHARRQGTCDNRKTVHRDRLENAILDGLRHRLMQPDMVAEFVDACNAELEAQGRQAVDERRRLERDLRTAERDLEKLLDAIQAGLRGPSLQARLDALEARKAELEARLADLHRPVVRLHPNLAGIYRERVARLHEALADPATRDEALGLVRGLIERVVVTPDGDGWLVDLHGAIAPMVALTQARDGTRGGGAVPGVFDGSVKVVAGAGFEPATFRL